MGFLGKVMVSLAYVVLFISLPSFEIALARAYAYKAIVASFIQDNQSRTTTGLPPSFPVVQTALEKAFRHTSQNQPSIKLFPPPMPGYRGKRL
jgi:hypothetical protein